VEEKPAPILEPQGMALVLVEQKGIERNVLDDYVILNKTY
jgi:hypothetical protein